MNKTILKYLFGALLLVVLGFSSIVFGAKPVSSCVCVAEYGLTYNDCRAQRRALGRDGYNACIAAAEAGFAVCLADPARNAGCPQ